MNSRKGYLVKKNSLIYLSVLFFTSCICAEEGDLIQYQGKCYVELADGTEEETNCPTTEDVSLSNEDKLEAIESLKTFESSADSVRLKKLASGLVAQSKTSSNVGQPQSSEDRRRLSKIRNDKFLVTLTFPNNREYPKKSARHGIYYNNIKGVGTEKMDQEFSRQWDKIIASELIGTDHFKYEAEVVGVTSKNVIVSVAVKSSDQLREIIDGKNVKSIDHAGTPLIEYEEIAPTTFTSK